MRPTTILFDMDGTLLPMDPDRFTAYYFRLLGELLREHGYDPRPIESAIWRGTAAMVRNDGSRPNEEAFWPAFFAAAGYPGRERELRQLLMLFYTDEFDSASVSCGYTPRAAETVAFCRACGWDLVVATNPIFPAEAMRIRLRWAGVDPDDFVRITSYENSTFSKPSPAYYREILRALGRTPEECVMIGNDVTEDMVAQTLGMRVFLLTDDLLNRDGLPLDPYPHGGYDELQAFLRALAAEEP